MVTPQNDYRLDRYMLGLVLAIREEVPIKPLVCAADYYYRHMTMDEIAQARNVNVSTVSRNIRGAEKKLETLIRIANAISQMQFKLGEFTKGVRINEKDRKGRPGSPEGSA